MVDRAWTASDQVLSCAMHELHGATSSLQKLKIPLSLSPRQSYGTSSLDKRCTWTCAIRSGSALEKTNFTGLGSGSFIVATIENRKRLYPSPGASRKQQIITVVSLLRCLYNAKLTQLGTKSCSCTLVLWIWQHPILHTQLESLTLQIQTRRSAGTRI